MLVEARSQTGRRMPLCHSLHQPALRVVANSSKFFGLPAPPSGTVRNVRRHDVSICLRELIGVGRCFATTTSRNLAEEEGILYGQVELEEAPHGRAAKPALNRHRSRAHELLMAAAPEFTAQATAAIRVHDRKQLCIVVGVSRSHMQILKLLGAFAEVSAPRMVTWCELGGSDASPPTARILRLNLQVKPTKSIFRHDLVVNTRPL